MPLQLLPAAPHVRIKLRESLEAAALLAPAHRHPVDGHTGEGGVDIAHAVALQAGRPEEAPGSMSAQPQHRGGRQAQRGRSRECRSHGWLGPSVLMQLSSSM